MFPHITETDYFFEELRNLYIFDIAFLTELSEHTFLIECYYGVP
jgi:hypothetical protein